MFQNNKKVSLSKVDKSRKGSIDSHIVDLVNTINENPHYYTTSSCSGRIVLQLVPKSGRKDESEWLYVSHEIVTNTDCMMQELRNSNLDVWFRMEAAILHVCCDSLENAQKLVDFARNNGFKRTGIQATNKKYIVEIIGSERIDAPLLNGGNLLVDDVYLAHLLDEANSKLLTNFEKLNRIKHFFKQ
ncbi:hypothetical protein KY337_00235 [Candidatus Woesearchaeota archaeon]|nr:hypothetical protein [Candidatus Woesearchaeota archaeon]